MLHTVSDQDYHTRETGMTDRMEQAAELAFWYLRSTDPIRVCSLAKLIAGPHLSWDWVERIAADPDPRMREVAAANLSFKLRSGDRETADQPDRRNGQDDDSSRSERISRLFETLATDEAAAVRTAVARNPYLPAPLFRQLWNSSADDLAVLRGLAANSMTPPRLLGELVEDERVSTVLWENENLPPAHVARVAELAFEQGCRKAARYLAAQDRSMSDRLMRRLAGHQDEQPRVLIGRRRDVPEDLLLQLAEDPSDRVRIAVARNIDLPTAVLPEMAEDSNHWIRKQIASRPDCPLRLFGLLSRDEDSVVRGAVARNPAAVSMRPVFKHDAAPSVRAAAGY